MSDRYPVSGYNDDAIEATNLYSIINTSGTQKLGVTTGRTYWLKSVTISNSHATANATFTIYDEAEAGTPTTPTSGKQRLIVVVAPANTCMVEFPSPGLQFQTGCSAIQASGTVAAYAVSTNGYEI